MTRSRLFGSNPLMENTLGHKSLQQWYSSYIKTSLHLVGSILRIICIFWHAWKYINTKYHSNFELTSVLADPNGTHTIFMPRSANCFAEACNSWSLTILDWKINWKNIFVYDLFISPLFMQLCSFTDNCTTSRVGSASPSGAPEFTPDFLWVRVAQSSVFV